MKSLFLSSLIFVPSLSTEPISLSNSCINKEDGEQWIQLSQSKPSKMMPVNLLCSSEYLILDYNKDTNLATYFSNIKKYNNDLSQALLSNDISKLSWDDWFIPCKTNEINSNDINSFISSDCLTCDINADIDLNSNNYCLCYKPNELQLFELTASQVRVYGNDDPSDHDGPAPGPGKENALVNDDPSDHDGPAPGPCSLVNDDPGPCKDGENEANEDEDEEEGASAHTIGSSKWFLTMKIKLAIIGFAIIFSCLITCVCCRLHFRRIFRVEDHYRNEAKPRRVVNNDIDTSGGDNNRVSENTLLIGGTYGSV